MPAISFSGHVKRGFFFELILKGEKMQTCRQPRKRPIEKGDHLRLYWKQRVPKENKPIHLIGDAVCVKVERLHYEQFAYDENFARADGFEDSAELIDWFGDPLDLCYEEYDVIHFQLLPRELAQMIYQAKEIVKYFDVFEILKRSRNYSFWKGYLKALNDVQREVFRDKKEDVMDWAMKQMGRIVCEERV